MHTECPLQEMTFTQVQHFLDTDIQAYVLYVRSVRYSLVVVSCLLHTGYAAVEL